MYKRSDLFYTALHIPFDSIAIIGAFIASYWLRGNGLEIYKLPFEDYMRLVYTSVPLWILIFSAQGLYIKRNLFGTLGNMSRVAISALAGWASFVVYLVFLRNEQTLVFPRLMLIYILILAFLFVFSGRLILRFIQFILRSAGVGRKRIMLIGEGDIAENMEQALLQHKDPGLQFIKRIPSMDIEGLLQELKKYKIDELIIADHSFDDDQIYQYINCAQDYGAASHMVPNMFEVQSSNVLFSTLAGVPLLTFRQTPLDGWGRIAKRFIDIVVASLALIVLSPVMLIISLAIKITDPGPAIYAHTRIGRSGKKFNVYKFRTMKREYCTGPGYNPKSQIEIFKELGRNDLVKEFKRDHKVKDDPRILSIGKILRRTRLDEIPQLFNVIKGDLSLVGPRPITEIELERYGRWGSYLLSIKPGATGLWQVSGGNDISYEERVRLDAHYVQNWSLWQDTVIIIKTVFLIIGRRGGY